MALRIEDYGLIGDCHTGALVGRNGSIDWLCLPRFDSGACFAALLGTVENGRWLLSPKESDCKVTRRYLPDTLILETEFETSEGGAIRITDFMPVNSKAVDLVRIVEGIRGEVPMQMDLVARFDYGSVTPWIIAEKGIISAVAGPDRLSLRTNVKLSRKDTRLQSEFVIRKGQRLSFTITWSRSNEDIPKSIVPLRALRSTERWWKQWAQGCTVPPNRREPVTRSLITLKALTYRPTGGIAAALTTSVPERIGGVRNWDYRYCWLRDASFTLFALMGCGYMEEARQWLTWLLRATTGHPAELQVLYGVAGERRLTELELNWLRGYEGSTPVRIGNAATRQFQLDVFGELLDAIHKWWCIGGNVTAFGWSLLLSMMDFLETAWKKPDEGIWEVRGKRRHFTHSKVMAWVAFDRAIEIAEKLKLEGPVKRWCQVRDEIRRQILEKGFDPEMNCFVQYFGAKVVDAALLRLPLVGFLPARDNRMKGTVAAIEKDLIVNGFVHRYQTSSDVDGLPEGEGAFLMCTLWYADVLHLSGRKAEAQQVFERVLGIRNDLGLLSEMYDPVSKRQVGNFPQGFSHVGVVITAMRLFGEGVIPDKLRKPSRKKK